MMMMMWQGPAGEKGLRGDSEVPLYDDKHRENVRVMICKIHSH